MRAEATTPAKGRGRPSIVDAMAISEAAIALWHEHGYANTGWREISDATGVSTRTLMRHFSSRAELAWIGVQPATERMAAAAPLVPLDIPLGDALRQLISASVTRNPKVTALGPDFFSLVSSEPEIAALAPSAHNPWITEVASFIAARRPDLPPAITRAIATAYQSALFAALTEWAENGDTRTGDAVDTVDAMLAHLGLLGE